MMRSILAALLFSLLCLFVYQRVGPDSAEPQPAHALRKPNILLIVVDDFGFNDLAINNGNPDIDTPNMDRLAREGMRFTRHYAHAVCSPARAALLTGLYPERLGFLPNGRGISPDVVTLPERLQSEGYSTWHIGKWHIGSQDRMAWPDHQGFDHWFGFLDQFRLAGRFVDGELQLTHPRYIDPWLEGDGVPGQHYTGHLDDLLTDRALGAMTDMARAGKPWFLNLWYFAPHAPITPSPAFAAKYPQTPAGKYRALVNQLDHNIGRVLQHLKALSLQHDTIVVVVSDNGGNNAGSNSPYPGRKTMMSEGGIRTPLLVRWVDDAGNGRIFSDSIGIEDLYPTLLSAAGIAAMPGLDGRDYYPGILGSAPVPRKNRFWALGQYSFSVLDDSEQLRYLRQRELIYVGLDSVLYDLQTDPTGARLIEPIPPEWRAHFLSLYADWFRDVHTVAVDYLPASGGGTLTGMDFLRTPGFKGYTFGLALPDSVSGALVSQQGVWRMDRAGSTVTARFGDLELTGDITAKRSCHSVVVTGDFHRKTAYYSKPDRIGLSMYIDGELVVSGNAPGALEVEDTTLPTVIGNPGAAPAVIAAPVILNTKLDTESTWTLKDFSDELCDAR